MEEGQVEHIRTIIQELKEKVSTATLKKLDLDKCERIVGKLGSYSSNCKDCQQQLLDLKNQLIYLTEDVDLSEETKFKNYKLAINGSISHLEKKHKLVQEGHYLAIYMSLGTSLGVVFGLAVFDNISLGIPIGLCLGLAIGASLDADSKKKGKTI